MICELCIALGGRFNAHRDCCRVRLLVGAPAQTRTEAYARLLKDEGAMAVAELKRKLRTELQRQVDHHAAIAKAKHDRESAKGREEAAALLKIIKESNMNVPPLERAGRAMPAPVREHA